MRLILGDLNTLDTNLPAHYILIKDDVTKTPQELKIPSGYQTGIKLVHQFEIVAGANNRTYS